MSNIKTSGNWLKNYTLLKNYYKEHGDSFVLRNHIVVEFALGEWVHTQRVQYGKSLLSQEQISKLVNIDFVWALREYSWNDKYNLLARYIDEHGTVLVPRKYIIREIELGEWVVTQRKQYNKGTLPKERIDRLQEIGFAWDSKKYLWNVKYDLLIRYIEVHNTTLVPDKYVVNEVNLGNWVHNQRRKYKNNSLSKERTDKLKSIRFF